MRPLPDRIAEIKKEISDKNGNFKAPQMHKMQELHIDLQGSVFQEMKRLLADHWFRKWFWLSGGRIRFNPLDFTTEEYFKAAIEPDNSKSETFEKYIDKIIDKYLLYDTTGKVDDFKKILALKGSGNTLYPGIEKLDKQLQKNKEAMNALLVTKRLLNKVQIHPTQPYYQYSAEKGFSTNINSQAFIIAPVRKDGVKKLIVHNVAKGYTAEKKKLLHPLPAGRLFN